VTEKAGRARRSWYYGWNIVAVLIVAQMAVSGITFNALSLFLQVWSRDLHAPVSQLTLALFALMLVGSPLQPIVGALADRLPARLLFGLGMLGLAAFFAAVSFVTAAWQVIALYAMCSIPLAFCTVTPTNAVIARWFVRRLGLALGISAFGMGIGGVALPPIIAVLLPEFGWRVIWRAMSVVMLLVLIPLVLLVLRDRPTAREGFHYLTPDGGEPGARRGGHGVAPRSAGEYAGDDRFGWLDVIRRRNFWLLVFIYLAVMGTGSGLHQNIAPFAASRGFDGATAALLISVMSGSHLVSTLCLGLLTDRFGARVPLTGLALAVGTGTALMIGARDVWLTVIAAALIGLNTGVFTPVAAAISAEFGQRHFGRAYGLLMLFVPLSAPLAYFLARIQERTGSYAPALTAFLAVQLAAALAALLLRPEAAQERQRPAVEAE